tara:strand:- start:142 stop:507 length:366 start_codon:yes stop_codon:yes gene_type:complete
MAAPNVVNVSSIYGKTMGGTLATSNADMLTCPTDKLLKINSIIVANVDGTDAADVTVAFYNADNTTAYHLAKTVQIPADSTLVVLGKDSPIYLEEGDKIQALASAASDLDMIISYEELDDA